jgi:hypothetical protein
MPVVWPSVAVDELRELEVLTGAPAFEFKQ